MYHKNYFLNSDDYEQFFGQLPDDVKDTIYLRFLFKDFMSIYSKIF